jgi:hypothetical protein
VLLFVRFVLVIFSPAISPYPQSPGDQHYDQVLDNYAIRLCVPTFLNDPWSSRPIDILPRRLAPHVPGKFRCLCWLGGPYPGSFGGEEAKWKDR